jgi:chorismate mutase-like protein
MTESKINNPRAEIDAIDGEILRLLNRRAEIALRVGAAKASVDTSLCDPQRESEVLQRLTGENSGPLDAQAVENIFQRIIDESLQLQQKTFQKAAEVTSEKANLSHLTKRRCWELWARIARRFRAGRLKICMKRLTPDAPIIF